MLNHLKAVDVLFLEPGWMDHSSSEQGFGIAGLGQRSGGPVKLRLAKMYYICDGHYGPYALTDVSYVSCYHQESQQERNGDACAVQL